MIHCTWIIADLILLVVAIIVRDPQSTTLQAFFSFAATVVSLFLGVIAIFYSMVSNQDQSNILQSTANSAQRVHDASSSLQATSNTIRDLISDLTGRVDLIPEEIRTVRSDITGRLEGFLAQTEKPSTGNEVTSPSGHSSTANVGVSLCLHLLAKSFDKKIPLRSEAIKKADAYFGGMFSGFSGAIKTFEPCGIKIDLVGSDVVVRSFGNVEYKKFLATEQLAKIPGPRKILQIFYDSIGEDSSMYDDETDTDEDDQHQ
jgi:hypothetical protein